MTAPAALLRLRGIPVQDDDAADVLSDSPSRLPRESQEHALIRGLHDVRQMIRERSSQGIPPDGWFIVELFKAIRESDYPVIQGCTLLITLGVLGANFLMDLSYGLIDPRVRAAELEEAAP